MVLFPLLSFEFSVNFAEAGCCCLTKGNLPGKLKKTKTCAVFSV
jgi:hypothetical protein